MQVPKMTTRRLMAATAIAAIDLTVLIYAPMAWALVALWLTASALVLGALVLLIRWCNRGPGKTLY